MGFGSKERPRTGLSVFCLGGKWGESQTKKDEGGEGKEAREFLQMCGANESRGLYITTEKAKLLISISDSIY